MAYETMVQLSKCSAPPLCNWALEIATSLRVIATEEINVVWDLIPTVGEGELGERPSFSLFERVRNGLSISCKSGPLPVDSFNFVFPVNFSLFLLVLLNGFDPPPQTLSSSLFPSHVHVDKWVTFLQIIEKILSSPKKTGLHDVVLHILFLHMDPILPLPRVQMLSVCNH